MKNLNQLIGCCGLDCGKCDARIATLTNDNALREKTAALWTKLNGVAITPEMINCTGCRMDGAKTPFCDLLCPVHNCVREKGLNIDYYPTNFVPQGGTLYYIDYECSAYMEQWDFEHWGVQYWAVPTSEG